MVNTYVLIAICVLFVVHMIYMAYVIKKMSFFYRNCLLIEKSGDAVDLDAYKEVVTSMDKQDNASNKLFELTPESILSILKK